MSALYRTGLRAAAVVGVTACLAMAMTTAATAGVSHAAQGRGSAAEPKLVINCNGTEGSEGLIHGEECRPELYGDLPAFTLIDRADDDFRYECASGFAEGEMITGYGCE